MYISVLDGEQNVCHFICDFAGTRPPKAQGTHDGHPQPQMRKYEHSHISEHNGNMPKHPPHAEKGHRNTGLPAFSAWETQASEGKRMDISDHAMDKGKDSETMWPREL